MLYLAIQISTESSKEIPNCFELGIGNGQLLNVSPFLTKQIEPQSLTKGFHPFLFYLDGKILRSGFDPFEFAHRRIIF